MNNSLLDMMIELIKLQMQTSPPIPQTNLPIPQTGLPAFQVGRNKDKTAGEEDNYE